MAQADIARSRPVADDPIAFVGDVARAFIADECPQRAASLAFYMVFAIPAIFILVILLGGLVVGESTIQREMTDQATRILGTEAEDQVRTFIENARERANFNMSAITSVGALLLGAFGALAQLQSAMNAVWNVRPDEHRRGLRSFFARPAFLLGMLLVLVFFVFIVLVMTTVSVGASSRIADNVENVPFRATLIIVNAVLTFVVLSALFTGMFIVMPDAKLGVRDVWIGAVATAVAFVIGQFVIGFWLSRTSVTGAFGAAGSLAILLLWIYYSGMILLAGAEVTRVLAKWQGRTIEPADHAVKVEIRTVPAGDVTEAPSDGDHRA